MESRWHPIYPGKVSREWWKVAWRGIGKMVCSEGNLRNLKLISRKWKEEFFEKFWNESKIVWFESFAFVAGKQLAQSHTIFSQISIEPWTTQLSKCKHSIGKTFLLFFCILAQMRQRFLLENFYANLFKGFNRNVFVGESSLVVRQSFPVKFSAAFLQVNSHSSCRLSLSQEREEKKVFSCKRKNDKIRNIIENHMQIPWP